jgi:hypothetical protein
MLKKLILSIFRTFDVVVRIIVSKLSKYNKQKTNEVLTLQENASHHRHI